MAPVASSPRRFNLVTVFLWLLGGFSAASWRTLAVFAAYALVPFALLFYSARALDLPHREREPHAHVARPEAPSSRDPEGDRRGGEGARRDLPGGLPRLAPRARRARPA